MAEDTGARQPKDRSGPDRRGRGFARAGGMISAQIRAVAARRGYVEARLRALWPEIAGIEFASVTRPVKLTARRGPAGGLLTLAVSGPHAPQIQMMLPQLAERVNAALGPGTVGRIQLTHGATGFAEAAEPFVPRTAPASPPELAPIAAGLSSIGDDDLRRALETLARNVLIRNRQPQ